MSIDGYDEDSGTSFSAPHISAVAAIAKCIDKNISAEEFTELIKTTSTDLGTQGYDKYYGYGLINAQNIIEEMLKDTNVFLSPVTDNCIKIYNNSDSSLSAVGISANYTEGRFLNAESYDVELLPEEIKEISFVSEGDLTKFMVWNSLEALKPLYRAREYKAE